MIAAFEIQLCLLYFQGWTLNLEPLRSWQNVHHRLISAIADSLANQLLPKYQVLIEELVYQTIGANSLLVSILDAIVPHTQVKTNSTKANIIVSSPLTQPTTVTLPIQEKIRQGHLEIRDLVTSEVVNL
ncbi:MAG: DUF4058 family protein [Symploca sp. SIO2B6]|nr:DUF4058 family protein [Symploca sp. SIO2B6]